MRVWMRCSTCYGAARQIKPQRHCIPTSEAQPQSLSVLRLVSCVPLGAHRGVVAALSRTASLRLLSLINCGVGGGSTFAARFAAHPYLRVRTRPDCQDALSTDAISLDGWLAA